MWWIEIMYPLSAVSTKRIPQLIHATVTAVLVIQEWCSQGSSRKLFSGTLETHAVNCVFCFGVDFIHSPNGTQEQFPGPEVLAFEDVRKNTCCVKRQQWHMIPHLFFFVVGVNWRLFFCMCWLCGRFQDSTRWYVMIVGCNFMRLFILRRPREMYEAVKEKNTKCKWERSVAVACGVVVNIYTFTFGFALKLFLVDRHIPGIYRTLILWKSIFCTVLSLK